MAAARRRRSAASNGPIMPSAVTHICPLCTFSSRAQECRVRDLASSNGTFLNGERVESAAIYEGDVIRAGNTTFTVHVKGGATNPEYLGIGIGEDAGVIVHNGTVLEAIGAGHVIVVDSSNLASSH